MVADLCLALLRFSGLTADDFVGVDMTLEEVQRQLLQMVAADTILLGHSLESDLRALKVPLPPSPALPLTPLAPPSSLSPKVIHSSVVDTAIVFPHRKGPPFKRALKTLMAEHLQRFIQDSAGEEAEEREERSEAVFLSLCVSRRRS